MRSPTFGDIADISIHAPVKGATRSGHGKSQASQISIHAPVKGATNIIGPTYTAQ